MARNLKFSTSLVDVPGQQSWKIHRLSLAGSLDWSIIASLVILVVLGFGLRINQLGAAGFAEDEMNKLDAVRAYQRGRTYFENRDELDYVRANFRKIHEVKINAATAVEVFVNHQSP